jgi:hypothetical protein
MIIVLLKRVLFLAYPLTSSTNGEILSKFLSYLSMSLDKINQ